MYVFKRKSVVSEVQFVIFSSRALATRIGGCSFFIDNQRDLLDFRIFTQTKLSGINRRTFLCLDEASRVPCNSDGTQTRKVFLLCGRDRLPGKTWQTCGKSRETLKFWNAAISKYINLIFYYVMQKLSIFNIYKIWTGVMWSTLKISSGAQLGHDKRDIPAFDTVFFHSNLSSLRRKYLSDVPTDK